MSEVDQDDLDAAEAASKEADKDLSDSERIGILITTIGKMDQDDDDLWNKDGSPSLPGIRSFVNFPVDNDMKYEAWARYNEGNTEAEKTPHEEPVAVANKDEATVTIDGEKVTVTRTDFKQHGVWCEGNRKISTMWVYLGGKSGAGGGTKFYQPVPQVMARKLPIYPWA